MVLLDGGDIDFVRSVHADSDRERAVALPGRSLPTRPVDPPAAAESDVDSRTRIVPVVVAHDRGRGGCRAIDRADGARVHHEGMLGHRIEFYSVHRVHSHRYIEETVRGRQGDRRPTVEGIGRYPKP